MKAVIFGAGASYDSVYEYFNPGNPFRDSTSRPSRDDLVEYYDSVKNNPWQPPLAKQLFSSREEFVKILDKYPGARSLANIAHERNDIEVFLEEMKIKIESHLNYELLAKFINIQFYLQELLGFISGRYDRVGYSNYEAIASFAHDYSMATKEDVIFVTFNYDTLLENAIERVLNTKFNEIDDYISSHLKVFKPHGSCNWAITSDYTTASPDGKSLPDFLYNNVDLYNQILPPTGTNVVVRPWQQRENFYPSTKQYQFHMPQIAIPLVGKTEFLLPQNHLMLLRESLTQVNEILIVGWRATEEHFLKLLKETIGERNIPITYVCGDMDEPINNISRFLPKQQSKNYSKNYFINTIEDSSYVIHQKGSFSSYVRNVITKREENYFATI